MFYYVCFFCSYNVVIHKFVFTVSKSLQLLGCKARVVVQIFLVKNSIYSNNNSAHLFVEDILSTVANVNNSIPENNEGMLTEYDLEQQRAVNNRTIKAFTCYCGKTCNGLLGLRARQTSCHISNIDELKHPFTPENNITQNNEHCIVEENDDIQREKSYS